MTDVSLTPEEDDNLASLAKDLILDSVRDESLIPFHRRSVEVSFPPSWTTSLSGPEELPVERQTAIVRRAVEQIHKECPSTRVELQIREGNQSYGVCVTPQQGREWLDVLRDIHGPGEPHPGNVLSPPGGELLSRVESGEFTRDFLSEQSVRARVRCFGWNGIEELIEELAVKRGMMLRIERKEVVGEKRRKRMMKFHIESRATSLPTLLPPSAPNPVFKFSGERGDVYRAFRRFIQQELVALQPSGTEPQPLWSFGSLASYWLCQPDCGNEPGKYPQQIHSLLDGTSVHPDTKLRWDLEHRTYFWRIWIETKRPWSEVLMEIGELVAAPDVAENLGLSVEAANLLRWCRSFPKAGLLLGCTPIVEEAIRKRELRLIADWPHGNLAALIELLCDEVTRKTSFHLKPVPWKDYSQVFTRIRVDERPTTAHEVASAIQQWLGSQGVTISSAECRRELDAIAKRSRVESRSP